MGDFKIKEIKNYMMTGISYLIPVCIIGGMFFAISIEISPVLRNLITVIFYY